MMMETKLILLLLGLAGLFCRTHGLLCIEVEDWSAAVPQIKGTIECEDGVTTCVRPRFQNGAYIQADPQDPTAVIWGCGECGTAPSCITPTNQNISNIPAIFNCYNNEVIADENKVTCDDAEITEPITSAVTVSAETSCKRPKIDSDGNFMTGDDAVWGCGKCPDGSDSCVSCDGIRCNGGDFYEYNCVKYTKSSEGTWIKDDVTTEVTCKGERLYCKMPTPDNKAEDWNSCGQNCDDEQCKSCYGNVCNDRDRSIFNWCKVGPADTIQAEVANLPLNFCSDTSQGPRGCQRPRIEYGKPVENAADYKCYISADCIPGKCTFCYQEKNCNDYPVNNHQCYDWSWDTNQYVAGDLQDCNSGDATISRCNMPKDLQNQVAYTPDTNSNGCGICSTEQADNCITTYAGDNRTPTLYQCYTWTWNSNKYEMGGPVDCNAMEPIGHTKDPIVCNMPRDLAIKNSYSASENDKGCGLCENGVNDTGCKGSIGARTNKPSDKQCYAWSWDSHMDKYVPGVLRHCAKELEFRCNKPRDVTKRNAYDPAINENGCGECSPSQPIGCITTPDSRNNGSTKNEHQCFSWSWVYDKYEPDTLALIECNQDRDWKDVSRSSKCNMPTKPEDKNSYEPDANVNGCGQCLKSDCITTYSGENKKPNHKCYKWTPESQGWLRSRLPEDCYQGDTEDTLKCSMPRNISNTEGINSNGCGPCPEEGANIADDSVESNCRTTGPEKNHGVQVLISFLVLVLAFVNVVV